MKCPKCGREIPQNFKFCMYCGCKVETENQKKVKTEAKWENNVQNRTLNSQSGDANIQNRSVSGQTVHVNNQGGPKRKKGPLLWIIIGALVLIAVTAIVIFFVLNNRKDDAGSQGWQTETEEVQKPSSETESEEKQSSETESEESRSSETIASIPQSEQTESLESESEESETIQQAAVIDMSYIRDIYASSELSEPDVTHSPDRLVDKDMTTAWAEGSEGSGVGESVVFMFNDAYKVSGIRIASGYQKNSETFAYNNMPVGLKLIFSDGTSESVKLEGISNFQDIKFSKPVETSSVTVEITEIIEGAKWNDSCITEIEFY